MTEHRTADANTVRLARASADPAFARAAQAFMQGRLPEAEHGARAILSQRPGDPAALLLLAEIANVAGLPAEAIPLLRRALTILPEHGETRVRLAELLFRQGELAEPLALLDAVLARAPADERAAMIRLSLLTQTGDYDRADEEFGAAIATRPRTVPLRLGHANLLRTLGRTEESAAAYRTALAIAPRQGEAWWGLADLKSGLLGADDIAAMAALADDRTLDGNQRVHLLFALARAEEDAGDYPASYAHYAAANRLGAAMRPHDADAAAETIDRSIALLTPAFFAERRGWGVASSAPIFVVGMPRAGSTLLEQMLASHSMVEGTAELPYIPQIAHELLAERWGGDRALRYPDVLAQVTREEATALGERYLARAAQHRRTARPFFIDKLNDNWPHIGLIQLILPHAVVIDARREAMACCFSNYKQHFARGRDFAYSQASIARQYGDYVRFTGHIEAVLPGRVHRVDHEALIADPEGTLRTLLEAMSLPWEAGCLDFHRNARPVRTASAAQVRRPIDRRSGEAWRPFRPWLGEMERALGPLAPE